MRQMLTYADFMLGIFLKMSLCLTKNHATKISHFVFMSFRTWWSQCSYPVNSCAEIVTLHFVSLFKLHGSVTRTSQGADIQ